MTAPIEHFADAYTAATGWGLDPTRGQQTVRCPAHADRTPSLSVGVGHDGRVLLTCHAGCDLPGVLDAVGLADADLYPPPGRRPREAAEWTPHGPATAVYDYRDETGALLFQVCRTADKQFPQRRPDPAAKSGWNWKLGDTRRVLYHLPAVAEAVKDGTPVWVAEGEKDADRLASLGQVATCNPGGASKGRSKWRPEFTASLTGAAEVRIVADDDAPGRAHATHVAAALRPHVRAVSVWLPAAGKDVSDHLDAGCGLADLRPFDTAGAAGPPADEEGEGGTAGEAPGQEARRGPSQASRLAALARERYELFTSADGRPYGVRRDGPNLALPLRGRAGLRSALARVYTDASGGQVPSQSALADAMTVCEGVAAAADPRTPHLRVARHDEAVVVDLGTPDGRCVVVGPHGWERRARSPVLFRRSGAMKPLPDPVRDGDGIAALRRLVNADDAGFRLLVAWLAASFIPDIPHPILTFRGEQGTGKSYAAKMVIGLVDPSGAPKRSAPRDVKAWATQAFNSWAICLDNVSTIPDWLSDALCKAVTGDGIVDRALYTDDDVVVLEFRRVLAMTTIDAGALAGDLAERLLTIELGLIPDGARRPETDLDAAYADAHPAILASVFDIVAAVLKALPDVHLDRHPRMADFARVLAAVDATQNADRTQRWHKWRTLATYTDTAGHAAAEALEGDPFGTALATLAEQHRTWTGTATELLEKITPERPPKTWPKDATRAGGRIRRLAPLLRSVGISVDETRDTGRARTRLFTFEVACPERRRETASAVPTASAAPPDLHGRSDANADASTHHADASVRNTADTSRTRASAPGQAPDLRERPGPADAAGATADAARTLASAPGQAPDQHGQSPADATGAADAVSRLLSGRAMPGGIPPGELGPCGRCRAPIRRYGPHATGTLCPACRAGEGGADSPATPGPGIHPRPPEPESAAGPPDTGEWAPCLGCGQPTPAPADPDLFAICPDCKEKP